MIGFATFWTILSHPGKKLRGRELHRKRIFAPASDSVGLYKSTIPTLAGPFPTVVQNLQVAESCVKEGHV